VLAIDSPGGYSQGVAEAAELLVAAGREKPVLAYISGTGASAAYWLAAAAEEIHAAPFADVGSIGTYSVTMDWSKYFLMKGVEVRVHRDGDLKGMGVMGKEWTQEELEYIQERVETTGKEFKDFIRARRPKIGEDEMRGQSFTARRTKAGEGRLVNGYEFRSLDRFLEAVAGEL
jgi:protease-4